MGVGVGHAFDLHAILLRVSICQEKTLQGCLLEALMNPLSELVVDPLLGLLAQLTRIAWGVEVVLLFGLDGVFDRTIFQCFSPLQHDY